MMKAILAGLLGRGCMRAAEVAVTLVARVLRTRHSSVRRSSRWVYEPAVRAYVWKEPEG